MAVSKERENRLMPRPRQRVCLDGSLKLDLNKLARQGLVRPGLTVGPNIIRWTYTYTEEVVARGLITASMEGDMRAGSGFRSAAWISGSSLSRGLAISA